MQSEDRLLQIAITTNDTGSTGKLKALAASYGEDAAKMVQFHGHANGPHFRPELVRLYARIAAHFALDVLQRRGESRMGE